MASYQVIYMFVVCLLLIYQSAIYKKSLEISLYLRVSLKIIKRVSATATVKKDVIHTIFLSSDNTTHNESKIKGKIVLATDFCLQDISMTKGFKNARICTCIQSCNKLQNNKLKFKQEKSRQVFKFFFLPKKIVLQLIAIYCND